MKKLVIIIIIVMLSLSLFACSSTESQTINDATEKPIIKQEATPTEKPTPTPEPSPTPKVEEVIATPKPHIDFDYISSLLVEPKILFMEDSQEIDNNDAKEFGDMTNKQLMGDGYEFTFVPNSQEHIPLNKKLDEFGGAIPKANQGIFIKFKTTTTGIYFSFLGENDFGIYFGKDGKPLVFTYTESQPFSFDGDVKLEVDKFYNMFMAMDKDGVFNCIIYSDDNSDNPSIARVALGETNSSKGYKNQSWQFEIATHVEGAITIEHYDVYTYETFIE